MHIGSVFRKGFYCSISFGNVYIGYTTVVDAPLFILFDWTSFETLHLEFEVGGYDQMENFLKPILKLTIETTLNSFYNYVI